MKKAGTRHIGDQILHSLQIGLLWLTAPLLLGRHIVLAGRFLFRSGPRFGNAMFHFLVSVSGEFRQRRFFIDARFPALVQRRLLLSIVRKNQTTEFGRRNGFSSITSIPDFQSMIPRHGYEALRPYISRHTQGETNVLISEAVVRYGATSGSGGEAKLIPVTKAMQRDNAAITRIWAWGLLQQHPQAFSGKILTIIAAPTEGQTTGGTDYGSAFSQSLRSQPGFIRQKYAIPPLVQDIRDFYSKYYCTALLGLRAPVSLISTANPSTLLALAEFCDRHQESLLQDLRQGSLSRELELDAETRRRIEPLLQADPQRADELSALVEHDPKGRLKPADYWPRLKAVVCWLGGNSRIYLPRLRQWFGELPLHDPGYIATEFRGNVPLQSETAAGPLTISQVFHEFIPVNQLERKKPNYYLAHQLEEGELYAIVITTQGGLYRYHINDIIRVSGFLWQTPQIEFVQKGRGVCNITGEKLYERQAVLAVRQTEAKSGNGLNFYLIHARPEQARYDFYLEFADGGLGAEHKLRFACMLDQALKRVSSEYQRKRDSFRLKPPLLKELAPGSLAAFRAWRVSQGVREAHFKLTPLSDDPAFPGALSVIASTAIEPA